MKKNRLYMFSVFAESVNAVTVHCFFSWSHRFSSSLLTNSWIQLKGQLFVTIVSIDPMTTITGLINPATTANILQRKINTVSNVSKVVAVN